MLEYGYEHVECQPRAVRITRQSKSELLRNRVEGTKQYLKHGVAMSFYSRCMLLCIHTFFLSVKTIMDLNDDFDLSEFLILDEEDAYTSSYSHEPPQGLVVKAHAPLTPPETPFDIHIADIKKEQDSLWDVAYSMVHNHQQDPPADNDTVCPLSIMLSPTSSSSTNDTTLSCNKDTEPVRLFPDLKGTKTIMDPSCQCDCTDDDDDDCQEVATPTVQHKRRNIRTPTSYDIKTSDYLIRIFYETYAQNKKLTKEQRAKIIKRTHLTSRKITYWFSNHKRRFKHQLEIYARLSRQGTITTYDDFVKYCRDNGVPGMSDHSNAGSN